jgi:hypothetical protein
MLGAARFSHSKRKSGETIFLPGDGENHDLHGIAL